MKRVALLVLVLALAAVSGSADTIWWDGQALASKCDVAMRMIEEKQVGAGDEVDAANCMGYVVASAELIGWEGYVDIPASVQINTLVKVVLKYLKEHPEELHRPARELVARALMEAYPPKAKEEG